MIDFAIDILILSIPLLILGAIWACLKIASINDRMNAQQPDQCPDCGARTWFRDPETGLPERHVCK